MTFLANYNYALNQYLRAGFSYAAAKQWALQYASRKLYQ